MLCYHVLVVPNVVRWGETRPTFARLWRHCRRGCGGSHQATAHWRRPCLPSQNHVATMTTTARPLQKVKYLQLTQLTPAHDAPQPAGEVDKPAAPPDEPRTGSYFPQLSRNARLMFWYVVISVWRATLAGACCHSAVQCAPEQLWPGRGLS